MWAYSRISILRPINNNEGSEPEFEFPLLKMWEPKVRVHKGKNTIEGVRKALDESLLVDVSVTCNLALMFDLSIVSSFPLTIFEM